MSDRYSQILEEQEGVRANAPSDTYSAIVEREEGAAETKPESQTKIGYMGIPYAEGSFEQPLLQVPPIVPKMLAKSALPPGVSPLVDVAMKALPSKKTVDVLEGLSESAAEGLTSMTSQKGIAMLAAATLFPEVGVPALVAYGQSLLPEQIEDLLAAETPKETAKAAGNVAQTGMMILGPVAGAPAIRERPPRLPGMSPEQFAANRAAVNLAAPGTMRPQELQMMAPPSPEPPPGMVVEKLPTKFSQVVGKGDVRFLEPPEPLPEPEPPPKVQAETRGKVSFGAEAPTLLRTAISPAATEALPMRPVEAETPPKPVAPAGEPSKPYYHWTTGNKGIAGREVFFLSPNKTWIERFSAGETGNVTEHTLPENLNLFEWYNKDHVANLNLPEEIKAEVAKSDGTFRILERKDIQNAIKANGFDGFRVTENAGGGLIEENIGLYKKGQQKLAAPAAEPKGAPDASKISTPTEVHGDVRPLEEPPGKLPVKEGGAGVQPQAQGGLPEVPQGASPEARNVVLNRFGEMSKEPKKEGEVLLKKGKVKWVEQDAGLWTVYDTDGSQMGVIWDQGSKVAGEKPSIFEVLEDWYGSEPGPKLAEAKTFKEAVELIKKYKRTGDEFVEKVTGEKVPKVKEDSRFKAPYEYGSGHLYKGNTVTVAATGIFEGDRWYKLRSAKDGTTRWVNENELIADEDALSAPKSFASRTSKMTDSELAKRLSAIMEFARQKRSAGEEVTGEAFDNLVSIYREARKRDITPINLELEQIINPPKQVAEPTAEPSKMTYDELKDFLNKKVVTHEGLYELENIYESNVGERAPKNSAELVDFLLEHYEKYPQDLRKDFKAPEPTAPKPKEPWEMTKDEWHDEHLDDVIARRKLVHRPEGQKPPHPDDVHKASVEQAIREGKPVPPEVLKEYGLEPKPKESSTVQPAIPQEAGIEHPVTVIEFDEWGKLFKEDPNAIHVKTEDELVQVVQNVLNEMERNRQMGPVKNLLLELGIHPAEMEKMSPSQAILNLMAIHKNKERWQIKPGTYQNNQLDYLVSEVERLSKAGIHDPHLTPVSATPKEGVGKGVLDKIDEELQGKWITPAIKGQLTRKRAAIVEGQSKGQQYVPYRHSEIGSNRWGVVDTTTGNQVEFPVTIDHPERGKIQTTRINFQTKKEALDAIKSKPPPATPKEGVGKDYEKTATKQSIVESIPTGGIGKETLSKASSFLKKSPKESSFLKTLSDSGIPVYTSIDQVPNAQNLRYHGTWAKNAPGIIENGLSDGMSHNYESFKGVGGIGDVTFVFDAGNANVGVLSSGDVSHGKPIGVILNDNPAGTVDPSKIKYALSKSQPPPAATEGGGEPGLIAGTQAEKWADQRINEQRKRTSVGLDPEFFAAATIKGAALIERGVRNFAAWSNEMLKLYGPAIESRLKDLYDSAVAHYNNARASADSMFVANKPAQDRPAGVLSPSTGQVIRSKLSLGTTAAEMGKEAQRLWRGFTMQALPRITLANRQTGEAGVRLAAANQVARAKGIQFAHEVVRSSGVDPVKYGIAISEDNLRDLRDMSNRNAQFMAKEGNEKEAAKWKAQADATYSFIGQEGSPFQTEQQWLDFLNEPATKKAIEWHKQLWAEQKDPLFRQANDLTADLPLPTSGQKTGARVNLMALTEEMEQQLGTGQGTIGASGKLIRQLATLKRRDPFSRQATGTGERYEGNFYEIMANGFAREYPVAMQHEFIRNLVDSGLAKIADKGESKYLLKLKGWKGKFLKFDRPDIAKEYEEAVGLTPSARLPVFTKIGELLTKASITGLAEGTTHASNLSLTAFTGLGPTSNPIANALVKSLGRVDLLYTIPRIIIKGLGDHEADMIRLAEIGAAKQPYMGAVSRRLLNPIDKGVRLVMADIYRGMAEKGIVPDTETGLREFVNESGNYNKRLQPWIIRTLRETQVQPFATAVHTWNVQGARRLAMSTAAKGTNRLADLALKADVAGGWIGAVVLLTTLNYLLNKNDGRGIAKQIHGPPGTPLGAVGWVGDDGHTHYWHLARWLGYERGLRITGIGPAVEAKLEGLSGAQVLRKGAESVAGTPLAYLGGPAVRTATIAGTGFRPSFPPVRESPVAPPTGDFNVFKNQVAYNIGTALAQVSPVSDSALRLVRGDPWEDAVTRQLSRYSPRTGMHPEMAEKLPEILEKADVNEYIKDIARRGRRMPEDKRDALFDEALNNIEDPAQRRKAKHLFRLISKE